jgi:hypothetical protein
MKRECGECTACCSVLHVKALNKPAGQDCKFLTPNGCGIYSIRPHRPCRVFKCVWLTNPFSDEDRPDKSGVILWIAQVEGQNAVVASLLPGREIPDHIADILDTVKVPVYVEQGGEEPVRWRKQLEDQDSDIHQGADSERDHARQQRSFESSENRRYGSRAEKRRHDFLQ